MSAIEDYLGATDKPAGGHQKTSPHAGNGAGDKPPADPEETRKILDARLDACRKLGRSAAACFVYILDRALHPRFFDEKGIVTLSDAALASFFKVTRRTIYNWKTEFFEKEFAWAKRKWRTNMWALTQYHISALHKKPSNGKTDQDGTYGNPKGKVKAPPKPAAGCRGRVWTKTATGRVIEWLPGPLRTPLPEPSGGSSVDLQQVSADSRNRFRLRPEKDFGWEPKNISAETRKEFRLGAETDFGCQPKNIAGGSRNDLPLPAETDCSLKRDSDPVNGSLESASCAINRVIALDGALREGKADWGHNWHDENNLNHFLDLCREVMTPGEVDDQPGGKLGNGGMWTKNFRRDAECRAMCWAVLRNARMKKREGFKPDTTWAQYVTDDWIRTAGAKAREKRP